MAESSSKSTAADKVGGNSDLVTEILIRVPIRSLTQFKTVSKHWLSLITSDGFSLRRNPNSTAVSGLYLHPNTATTIPELHFIPLINTTKTQTHKPRPQFTDLAFFRGLLGNIRIISSCNGLLLCCFYTEQNYNRKPEYVILNPTTKQFKILPTGHLSNLIGLTLAFDPSKSPHYNVVCVLLDSTYPAGPCHHNIMTYSSETGACNASSVPFAVDYNKYDSGVYWNGAIHWFSYRGSRSEYYNIDEGRMGIIPVLPIRELRNYHMHYGESGGHLHLIKSYDYGPMNQVDVYEMARDYSRWLVKYRVDDLDVARIQRDPWRSCSISVLCVVRMERDEDSFMVLHVPGKILSYSFGDGNLKEICDVVAPEGFDDAGGVQNMLRYFWSDCYPYIESLSCV